MAEREHQSETAIQKQKQGKKRIYIDIKKNNVLLVTVSVQIYEIVKE
jgi:hypothetical protein